MSEHRIFVDGRVHVRATRCPTCIFRPGNLMELADGRVEGMLSACADDGSVIPCHHHLYEDAPIEPICRGFYERGESWLLRLADGLDLITFGDPDA